MKWITLTPDMLPTMFNAAELAAVTSKQGTETFVQDIIDDTVADIRARLVSCGRVKVDANPATIPQALATTARSIIRYELLSRYSLNIAEPRVKQWEEANRVLRDISSGSYILTETGETTASPGYKGRPHRFGPNQRGTIM